MAGADRDSENKRLEELLEEERRLRHRLVDIEGDVKASLLRRSVSVGPSGTREPGGKDAYRTSEIAKRMSISEMTVLRAIQRGDLRAVKLDPGASTGVRLILRDDYEAWKAGMR